MPSSPTLQPQRGVEGNSAAEETDVDKLVDETAVEVEATACDVETPEEDADRSCNDDAPRGLCRSYRRYLVVHRLHSLVVHRLRFR